MTAQADRLLIFTNKDEFVREIAVPSLHALAVTRNVAGEFSISLQTTAALEKGQRLLLRADLDGESKWYEFVVESASEQAEGAPLAVNTYYGIWSLQHDLELCAVSGMPGVQSPVTAAVALQTVLESTARWTAGTIDVADTAGASMYEMSAWEALGVLATNWECEFDAEITVGATSIESRQVVLADRIGRQSAAAMYELARNAARIVREVDEAPRYCRIIPKGMGEETEDGGYGRRIGIEDVNGGVPWIQDDDAVDDVKLPDGSGGWEYPTCYVENAEIDDPAELLQWSQSVLHNYTQPRVRVTADITRLRSIGSDALNPLAIGDVVRVVDEGFHDGSALKVDARVTSYTIDLLDPSLSTFSAGTELEGMSAALSAITGDLSAVQQRANLAYVRGGVKGVKGSSEADYRTGNVEITPANLGIQTGTFSMTPVANGIKSETIAFDRAYASMPLVFVDVASGVEATLRDRRFGATATTTEITITCYNAGTNTTSRRVNWLAIGELA